MDVTLYIDADACPVKAETFRVAERYGLAVWVVANGWIAVPRHPLFHMVVVAEGPDVADDWIAERAGPGSIVITADIPLASRSVAAGALALSPSGKVYDSDSVGMALATRNLMTGLRETGQITGGPAPFSPRDRSRFLSALDMLVNRLRRKG